MKYLLAGLLTVMLVGSVGTTVYADICAMSVTVTVAKTVVVSGSPLTFPSVAAGAGNAVVSTAGCTVTNTGSTTESYNLELTAAPAGWSVLNGTGNPGAEQFKLLALFTSETPAASGSFVDGNDVVCSTTVINAASAVYGNPSESVNVQGFNCTASAVRTLWFKFMAPSATVLTTQQWMTVTVSAY
jgi:hypothetical protein